MHPAIDSAILHQSVFLQKKAQMLNEEELEYQRQQQLRLEQARIDANPSILTSFLALYIHRFLVDPNKNFVYFIQSASRIGYPELPSRPEFDGIAVKSWSFRGPSKYTEHRGDNSEINAGDGNEEKYLAGVFQRIIKTRNLVTVEISSELIEKIGGVDNLVKSRELPAELLPVLYSPIRQRIDRMYDEYWNERLVEYEEILLLPQEAKVTIRRNDYIKPDQQATEVVEGILYFVTINGSTADGIPITLKGVEKAIKIIGMREKVNEFALGSPFPDDVKRKHILLIENGIPTHAWLLVNEENTKIFTPDLTEDGKREVIDGNVYTYHIHPEQSLNQDLKETLLPPWVREHSGAIDSQLADIKDKLEQLGFEVIKDSYFIIQPIGNETEPKVIIGDLGLGLLHPDDPNKGQINKRFTL